jgi:hypothetical protein
MTMTKEALPIAMTEAVFELPGNMQISVGYISSKKDGSDRRLAVWFEEKPTDGAAGAVEITNTPLGQFLLRAEINPTPNLENS